MIIVDQVVAIRRSYKSSQEQPLLTPNQRWLQAVARVRGTWPCHKQRPGTRNKNVARIEGCSTAGKCLRCICEASRARAGEVVSPRLSLAHCTHAQRELGTQVLDEWLHFGQAVVRKGVAAMVLNNTS